jgi:hypothetical protein
MDRNIVIIQEDIIQSVLEERGRNRETNGIDEDKNEGVLEEEQQKVCSLLEAVDVICSVSLFLSTWKNVPGLI